ncbi:MAG: CBO0543 family protein [Tumebacillaceae bacterium]
MFIRGKVGERSSDVREKDVSAIIWIAVIWFLLAVFLPKRMKPFEKYTMCMFTIAFAWTFDSIFGVYFDLYDYGDSPQIEICDIVQITVTNPSIALLFLNYLPSTWTKRIMYLTVWSAFLLLFEVLYVKVGFMTYKGWSVGISACLYPLLLIFMALNFDWMRYMMPKATATPKKATDELQRL